MLGSISVALIGVGLLIWQFGGSTDDKVVANNAKTAGLQLTVTPPPGTVLKVEGANPQVAQGGASVLAPTATAPAAAAADKSKGATATTPATAAADKSKGATATATTASPAGSVAAGAISSSDAKASAQPVPLLDVDKLALAPPATGASGVAGRTRPAAPDPQLLADLALYQAKTGDLTAAIRSIDRASELLGAKRGSLSSDQLDAFNRAQVEVRAVIASQYYQRQELATAQTHWFRATHLANAITTPIERARALSGLARTLYDGQASTAEDYFNRAIETAQLVKDPVKRVIILSAVARDLTGTKRIQQSQDLFGQAASIATTIQNSEALWYFKGL
jgi:tetratricopeptide (TPR) repeat protein